jgi:hypothetical protein
MENTKTELERKVEAIDRKNRRVARMLDGRGLTGTERADAFHDIFRKTLTTWGITEEEYIEASLNQSNK